MKASTSDNASHHGGWLLRGFCLQAGMQRQQHLWELEWVQYHSISTSLVSTPLIICRLTS